jgi:hypothetical protein
MHHECLSRIFKKMTPENHLLKRVFSRPLFDENRVPHLLPILENRIRSRETKLGNCFEIFVYSVNYHILP